MKIAILSICLLSCLPKLLMCMPVDSSNWPLPTKFDFTVNLSGQFRNYLVVTDGQGHHFPGEYDMVIDTSIWVPNYMTGGYSIDIDLSSANVSHSLKGTVGHILMQSTTDLPTITTGLDFVLDTATQRLMSLRLTRNYTFSNSQSESLELDFKDLSYSTMSIQADDREIRNHITYASYSAFGGNHYRYSGLDLVNLQDVNLQGTLGANLMFASLKRKEAATIQVFSLPQTLRILFAAADQKGNLLIYQSDGELTRSLPISANQTEATVNDLSPGFYFIRLGQQTVKAVVLP